MTDRETQGYKDFCLHKVAPKSEEIEYLRGYLFGISERILNAEEKSTHNLSPEFQSQIKYLRKQGKSYRQISRCLGISRGAVYRTLKK